MSRNVSYRSRCLEPRIGHNIGSRAPNSTPDQDGHQVQHSTRARACGTGVGLRTARKTVQRMSKLRYQSEFEPNMMWLRDATGTYCDPVQVSHSVVAPKAPNRAHHRIASTAQHAANVAHTRYDPVGGRRAMQRREPRERRQAESKGRVKEYPAPPCRCTTAGTWPAQS